MATPTFVVFIGAGGPLSLELRTIEQSHPGTSVIAPAAKKSQVGLNCKSVPAATASLKSELQERACLQEMARLIVFFYDGFDSDAFQNFWHQLGRAAWVEYVPSNLKHKLKQTRQHIAERIQHILPLLHEVSGSVFKDRRKAALPLPLGNYQSDLSEIIDRDWYRELHHDCLKIEIERLKNQLRDKWDQQRQGFKDRRDLIFKPCRHSEEHGVAHPQGASARCFIAGRFRFGAALAPGFHYDVEAPRQGHRLEATLLDCDGNQRDMGPEKRDYINIHPNDYLRPVNQKG